MPSPPADQIEKPVVVSLVLGTVLGAGLGRVFGSFETGAALGAMLGLVLGAAWDLKWLATRRYLFWATALPMAALTAISLSLSFLITDVWTQGVLIGMTGTWIGVLVTVFYVEFVLQEHENKRWNTVEIAISVQIHLTARESIMQILKNYKIGDLVNLTETETNPQIIEEHIPRYVDILSRSFYNRGIMIQDDPGLLFTTSGILKSLVDKYNRLMMRGVNVIDPTVYFQTELAENSTDNTANLMNSLSKTHRKRKFYRIVSIINSSMSNEKYVMLRNSLDESSKIALGYNLNVMNIVRDK